MRNWDADANVIRDGRFGSHRRGLLSDYEPLDGPSFQALVGSLTRNNELALCRLSAVFVSDLTPTLPGLTCC